MGVRIKPLGAFDCEGCAQGWHMSRAEVRACTGRRLARATARVQALRRAASDLRLSIAHNDLRHRIPPRWP